MNIAHIESSKNWGGQELRIIEQSIGLMERGHNVWIIAREESKILKEAKERGIPFYALDLRGSVNPTVIKRLLQFVKENDIDILDSHSSRDASYSMFVHLFTGTKVIRSRHVTDKIKNDFFHRIIWKYGNSHIITTAQKIKDDIVSLKLAKPEKIDVALAGVDEQRFNYGLNREDLKKSLGIPLENIVIANIGMIREDKGQEYYVEACKLLAKEVENITFLQIGEATDSTKRYKNKVLECGKDLIEKGQLKFLGYKSDIENYMAITDMIVIASIATEAQTRLVSQAFLMKKNVIATTTGGLPEMIENNQTGILCKPKSSESLKDAVLYLIRDKEERERMIENAYSHALKYMTFEKMMEQMENIYKYVVGQNNNAEKQ